MSSIAASRGINASLNRMVEVGLPRTWRRSGHHLLRMALTVLFPLLLGLSFFTPFEYKLPAFILACALAIPIFLSEKGLMGLYLLMTIVIFGAGIIPLDPNPELFSLYLIKSYTITITDWLLLLCLGAWFGQTVLLRRRWIEPSPLNRPMALLLVAVVVGLIVGKIHGSQYWDLVELDKRYEFRDFLYLPVMFFLCYNVLDTRDKAQRFLTFMIVMVFLRSLVGLYRFLTNPLLPWSGVGYAFLSVDENYLFFIIGFLIVSWIAHRRFGFLTSLLVGAATLPMWFCIAASHKRSAAFVFLLALGFFLYGFARTRKAVLVALVSVLLIGSAMPVVSPSAVETTSRWLDERISQRVEGKRKDTSIHFRYIEIQNVLLTLRKHPIWGLGFHQPYERFYSTPIDREMIPYILHNGYLFLWLKMGLAGLITFLWVMWAFFSTVLRNLSRLAREERAVVLGLAAALFGNLFVIGTEPSLSALKFCALMGWNLGFVLALLRFGSLRPSPAIQRVVAYGRSDSQDAPSST